MSSSRPHAFLFSAKRLAEHKTFGYDKPALRAVFASVLTHDEDATLASEVYLGDLMLRQLAEKRVETSYEGPDTRPLRSGVRQLITTDRKLYPLVLWDFCDSISDRWHTLNLAAIPGVLRKDEIFCITFSSLTPSLREPVDRDLKSDHAYLGAYEVDPGDSIQTRSVKLIHRFDYLRRGLVFDPMQTEDPFDPPTLKGNGWYRDLPFAGLRYRVLDKELEVPAWPTPELSERGQVGYERLQRARDHSHLDRLVEKAAGLHPGKDTPAFHVSTETMPRASFATVAEKKLREYVLNPDSDEGASKAKFFREELGIEADDWLFLADQFRSGIAAATELERVRSEEHGLKYHAIIPVKGRNGRVLPVLTAWIVKPGEPPALTTAHPASKSKSVEDIDALQEPKVLPADLEGEERWETLWTNAIRHGRAAAENIVPTPMLVETEWVPDGMFGAATVTVPDARRGFARWLLQTENADLFPRKGALVFFSEGSADRSSAMADAFADVLHANGIESVVETHLD